MRTTNESAVTVTQAAAILSVHPQTIRRLIATGRLPALRLSAAPHGHLRIPAGALDRFMSDEPSSTATELQETR
jgi:excisionase family DNA binding protein